MAEWKKVIVSGSNAELNQLNVGSNQQITTNPATTYLSGSFSGSFQGTADLPDASEWKVVITFIVIDRANLIYPFQVSPETLKVWEEDFKNILNVVDYHYSNKDFTLPYELATGKIKL